MSSLCTKRIFSELVDLSLHVIFTDLTQLLVQRGGNFIRTKVLYCLQAQESTKEIQLYLLSIMVRET